MRGLGKIDALRHFVYGGYRAFVGSGRMVRIPAGPLRGYRWFAHPDHQFWMALGAYESETVRWLTHNLATGMTFFDIGANSGYFTLLGAKLVQPGGRVVAFEPVPLNVDVIQRQLSSNHLTATANVQPVAVSNALGIETFTVSSVNANSHMTSVDAPHTRSQEAQAIRVPTCRLDDWCAEHDTWPDVVKVDVEGAEALVLDGAIKVLAEARPRLIVSTHSAALRDTCSSKLGAAGYKCMSLPGFEHEILGYPSRPRA